ncbi:carbohydrate ABC transporter permease [Martelella soudanensis]|uniref:carbohydrate ABC transporter permease n=1 Tax=unclassified Martelella TaxID=2629616 RepID=UPI0015DF0523|nr:MULTISPECIES: carbohydrate ABC transporter permease [unclassified Martelella]
MKRSLAVNILLALTLLALVILVALPFYWVASGSFKLPQEIIARKPTFFPHSFTLQHYVKLLANSAYTTYVGNSLILRRVMLPLIAPGMASVAIFAFITSWTEYVFASVLIISDAKRTVPVGFAGIIGQYQIDWGLLLAGVVLAVAPVVIFFAFIGRWFVSGLTEGAVK